MPEGVVEEDGVKVRRTIALKLAEAQNRQAYIPDEPTGDCMRWQPAGEGE